MVETQSHSNKFIYLQSQLTTQLYLNLTENISLIFLPNELLVKFIQSLALLLSKEEVESSDSHQFQF